MPHRTRAHQHHAHHHEASGANASPERTPLDQALIENSELKLLLFKTFATLSTYASGFSDGGAQARKTLDMLHHRMYVGGGHDHGHDEDEEESVLQSDKTPSRQVS